jgi:hypothetical protein
MPIRKTALILLPKPNENYKQAKKYAPIFKTLMETGLMAYELAKTEARIILFK